MTTSLLSSQQRIGQLIRSNHPWAYRRYQWATIVGTTLIKGRTCWIVEWDDGIQDQWVVDDPDGNYQFATIETPSMNTEISEARFSTGFHVATILSITDGHLLVPFKELRRLFGWLVGEEDMPDTGCMYLHDQATEVLLKEFPQLIGIEVPDGLNTDEKISDWLVANEFNYWLQVPQLLEGTKAPS